MDSTKREENSDDEMPKLERMDYCFEYPEEIKLEVPAVDSEWYSSIQPLQNRYVHEVTMDEVKEEPLENGGFKQELMVPKEEEPDDHQNYRQLDPNDESDSSLGNPKHNRQVYRKCQVCSRLMSIELMTKTELNDSKLCLLVGLILDGRMLIEEALLIYSEPTVNACHAHFSDAVDKIFIFLGIRNIDEMRICSKANISELTGIVNTLKPSIVSIGEFYYLLLNYIQKFRPLHKRIFKPKKRTSDRLSTNTNQQINGNPTSKRPVPRHASLTFPFQYSRKVESQPLWFPNSGPRRPMPCDMSSYVCSPKINRDINENCYIFSTEGNALHHENSNQQSALAPTKCCTMGSNSLHVVTPVLNVQQNINVVRGSLSPILPHVKYNKKCAVCNKAPGDHKMLSTRSKDRKLVLFVGLVIGLQKSIKDAQELCYRCEIFFCKTHLKDVMNAILKFLRIEWVHQMNLCSMDKKEKLMIVVNWMSPETTYTGFFNVLNDIITW